jgi:propionate CoA-transferase
VCFLTTFTAKGLETTCSDDGALKIVQEGTVKKFVQEVFEITFSGDEAVRQGQAVYYVSERAVFVRSSAHATIELVEIAPGVDLQRHILDQMDFAPVVSPHLKEMDPHIFRRAKMGIMAEMFGSLQDRCTYHPSDHTLFINMFVIIIDNESDISCIVNGLASIVAPLVAKSGPIHVVSNYDGFDIRDGLEEAYSHAVKEQLEIPYYESIRQFAGKAFRRALLGERVDLSSGQWTTCLPCLMWTTMIPLVVPSCAKDCCDIFTSI